MAICGRCGGQTGSASDVCPSCSQDASATVSVGADSSSASSPEHLQVEPEFAALPHFERPFAARGTVWPQGPELVPGRTSVEESAPDFAAGRSEERDSEEPGPELGAVEQSAVEQSAVGQLPAEQGDPEELSMPVPEQTAGDAGTGSAQLVQPAALPRSGRWIALTAANAVLLLAAAGAVTLIVHHAQATQAARIDRPSETATPSRSASPTLARSGPNELSVAPAAAAAPDEAAIVASLNRYFDAINNHDYWVYKRTFILSLRGRITPASFRAGFGTATDVDEQLHSITAISAGKADAFVTFVSQQWTGGNAGSSGCTVWSVEFYLGRRGSRYLLVAPPQWYQASDTGCA